MTVLSQSNSTFSEISLGVGINDSLKKDIATALTEGNRCLESEVVYKKEIANLKFQVTKQGERINTMMASTDNLKGQKEVLQKEIVIHNERIQLKDQQILKLKTTRWIIISISGIAIITTFIVASQI